MGITEFKRAPAFNGDPVFQDALAEIVLDHLRAGEACSSQYGLQVPGLHKPRVPEHPEPCLAAIEQPGPTESPAIRDLTQYIPCFRNGSQRETS